MLSLEEQRTTLYEISCGGLCAGHVPNPILDLLVGRGLVWRCLGYLHITPAGRKALED